jgi:hypothetical protein
MTCVQAGNGCVRLKTCGHLGRHITKYAAKLKQDVKVPNPLHSTIFLPPSSAHVIQLIFNPFLCLIIFLRNLPEKKILKSQGGTIKGRVILAYFKVSVIAGTDSVEI